jgi:hypothetical protein
MDELGTAELMFLLYLRLLTADLTNKSRSLTGFQWDDVEEIIKNSDYNEYWRYLIAIELIKQQVLFDY